MHVNSAFTFHSARSQYLFCRSAYGKSVDYPTGRWLPKLPDIQARKARFRM